ncbi:adenosylmethionine--8-amino-7-oxononanoate transaminase [Arachidicoccus ginsenosidimutans]|uniref:adenosylmethionine--8-amino-7-oxononanoate transaminase n=1 Tax=Arachidicoccus sp. BS20 TaxID=1850526 RepID=UPI0007F0968C|nr:adenosylmethionine--8-amino-7-oxononanoate transaminase [Arachidicoccus sp. BS20]ANI87852.1 adenosylmethionine--8-amino-7-oxononanoate transaminase [Arachidicoccus sp. BS20]
MNQKTLTQRDKNIIWHPYTQMKRWSEAIGIVKAKDAILYAEDGKQYIDAGSSWWVTLHGHSNTHIAKRISEQLTTMEHCIFAGFTHEPAVELAERLLPILPGDMARIFYSDNGSTAVEVALKMAHQYHQNKNEKQKTKIVAIEGAYHGDTFGAMSVSARSLFTEQFNAMLFDVSFIPFPSKANEGKALGELENILKQGNVSSFIVEPLVQGSGGMRMYSPETLEKLFLLCKKYDCLVIADEVMTGFGRTGTLFACNQLKDAKPDIVCLSKGLTGGTLPMGITACTAEIFDAFLSDDAHKTLYHGHSFTANPIGCAAALASLELLLSDDCQKNIQRIVAKHCEAKQQLSSHPKAKDVRQTGTILAVEIDTGETDYLNNKRDFIYQYFLNKGLLMRPLGNIIYLLPPYCISDEQLDYAYQSMEELLEIFNTQ